MHRYQIFYTIAALTLAAVFATACDKEEVETTEGGSQVVAGKLDDTKGSKTLPEGYRLKSVGSVDYFYTDGKLSRINVRNNDVDVSESSIHLQTDNNETADMTLNKNGLITKITSTFAVTDVDGSLTINQDIALTYNSKNQLSSITGTTTESGKEDGADFTKTTKGQYSFEYVNKGLKKVVVQTTTTGVDKNGAINGKSRTAYTFYHEDDNDNVFGQWTPNLAHCILGLGDLGNALAYAGYFGRASYKLARYIYEDVEEELNGSTSYDENSYSCLFTLDSYGAIQMADYLYYTYADISSGASSVKATRANVSPLPKPFDERCYRNDLIFLNNRLAR